MDAGLKNGPETTYYESGQMHTKTDIVGNKRHGEFLVFYPEGPLKRREKYEHDLRISGECLAPDGSPVAFYEYEVMPRYKGEEMSNGAMVRAIQRNVRYPSSALNLEKQGRVFVSFQVTELGAVADVRVIKGLGKDLDAAVITAVKKLSGFAPGMLDGRPVAVDFALPITFKIIDGPPAPFNQTQPALMDRRRY
jgi:protein TonB